MWAPLVESVPETWRGRGHQQGSSRETWGTSPKHTDAHLRPSAPRASAPRGPRPAPGCVQGVGDRVESAPCHTHTCSPHRDMCAPLRHIHIHVSHTHFTDIHTSQTHTHTPCGLPPTGRHSPRLQPQGAHPQSHRSGESTQHVETHIYWFTHIFLEHLLSSRHCSSHWRAGRRHSKEISL